VETAEVSPLIFGEFGWQGFVGNGSFWFSNGIDPRVLGNQVMRISISIVVGQVDAVSVG